MMRLNIIGAGKVASTLARLWAEARVFEIGAVLNRSSSASAVAFIGTGTACSDRSQLGSAEAWMIGTPDDAVAPVAHRLADSGLIRDDDIVFHLSGALAANVMASDGLSSKRLASLHPLKSIPDAARAWETFAGTWCGLEGDSVACEVLEKAVVAIKGHAFRLRAANKMRYHAANAMLSNLLIALLASGEESLGEAGIAPADALRMVAPLMRETLENGLGMGPQQALTGPLVRGDLGTVRAHLEVLDDRSAAIYRALGRQALALAEERGHLEPEVVEQLHRLLDGRVG